MLNPALNINVLSHAYAQNRLIVIRNALLDEVALKLQQALEDLDWFLEIKDHIESNILRIPLADVKTPDNLLAVLDNSEHHLDRSQLFFMRPLPGWAQYRTPVDGLYLCGAGTHPGGGVTGAPGYNAARRILRDLKVS